MNIKGTVRKVSEDIGVEFKDKQLEAIKCLCVRQDIFISFPTGYGNLPIVTGFEKPLLSTHNYKYLELPLYDLKHVGWKGKQILA